MRQIWISKAGPPETLALKEAPDPNPRAGEARIRVEASGVNFADVMGRMGLYPDLPKIPVVPGYEVAGRVDAVGEGVDPAWIGRNVFALTRFGGYADVVCAPDGQDLRAARGHVGRARRGDPGELYHRLATHCRHGRAQGWRNDAGPFGGRRGRRRRDPDRQAPRRQGHWNGVRRQAPGTARARCRSPDRLSDRGLREAAREITQGRGVELILDAVGGKSFKKGYRLLAPTGRLGMFGASSAARNKTGGMLGMVSMLAGMPWLQFNPLSLMNANKGVFGVNLGHMWDEGDRIAGWVDELVRLWEQGAIKPRIARTFHLRRGRGRSSLHPGPQQPGKGAAHPVARSVQESRRAEPLRRWDAPSYLTAHVWLTPVRPVLNPLSTLRKPPNGVATDFLRGLLAEHEAAHRFAHRRLRALPSRRHSPEPHEPQRLHDLRDDVRAGDEGAAGRARRDYPVRRSQGLHEPFAVPVERRDRVASRRLLRCLRGGDLGARRHHQQDDGRRRPGDLQFPDQA